MCCKNCGKASKDDSTKSEIVNSDQPSFLSYRGRSRRRTYWCTTLGIGIASSSATFIAILPFLNELANGGMDDLQAALSRSAIGLLIAFAIVIITFFLLLPVSVRRLHDRNMSGWWILVFMIGGAIPCVGLIVCLVQFVIIGCLGGTSGQNRFGADPRE